MLKGKKKEKAVQCPRCIRRKRPGGSCYLCHGTTVTTAAEADEWWSRFAFAAIKYVPFPSYLDREKEPSGCYLCGDYIGLSTDRAEAWARDRAADLDRELGRRQADLDEEEIGEAEADRTTPEERLHRAADALECTLARLRGPMTVETAKDVQRLLREAWLDAEM
jgi:hypothetical protein